MDNRRPSAESDQHDPGAVLGEVEEEDDLVNNTLYELTSLQEYTARKVEADDIRAIQALLKDEDYSQFKFEDPVLLFETCCFSIAVSDVIESDRLVAAAFFDDRPAFPDLLRNSKKWKASNEVKSMVPINTLHLRCFVCNPEVAEDVCLTEIIAHTFSSSIHIDYIVVEMPDLNYSGPYVFSPLVKEIEIVPVGKQKRKIVVYKKDLLMPHLIVREGREHDLDDLMSLLPIETPVMEQHFGKSSLSDVISMADKANQSMVAEWKGEAVGIISVSADLDYELLNGLFFLEPFHGLRKPYSTDEIYTVDSDKVIKIRGDVGFDDLFDEAMLSFQIRQMTKGFLRKNKEAEATMPYDIEQVKELHAFHDSLSDEESSAADKILDDKPPRPHQFTAKVSQDIILYGLRKRQPIEMDRGSASEMSAEDYEYDKEIMKRLSEQSDGIEFDEEEEDEEEVEDEEEMAMEQEEIEVLDGDDITISEDVIRRSEEGGESLIVEGGEGSEEMLNLMMALEDGEMEEGEDQNQEVSSTAPLNLAQAAGQPSTTAPVQMEVPIPAQEKEKPHEAAPSVSPGPRSTIVVEPTHTTSAEEHPEETEARHSVALGRASEFNLSTTAIESALPVEAVDLIKPPSTEETAVDQKLSPTRKPSQTDSPPSGTDSDAGALDRTGIPEDEDIEARQSMGGALKSGPKLEPSRAYFDKNTISMLQQLSPEVRRRLSEDTLFVGRRVPVRTFDQKVELLKKVWDVYNMIHGEGLSLEQARDMLTPADIDSLEEAESLVSGNLLKYIAALLPDESKYPFPKPLGARRNSQFKGIANALAVKLFNMGSKYMLRHMDMFRDIFKSFPNREYLVVTVPVGGNVKEPPWLDNFVRVIPRPESNYPRDLFVCHKAAIVSKVRARRARERDMGAIKNFLNSLIDREKIFQDFLLSFTKVCIKGVPKMNAYVLEVKNYSGTPIIGLAMVSKEVLSMRYAINYNLEKHTYYSAHDSNTSFGYLHHLIINPIFQRHARVFLKEVMRIEKKDVLFHCVFPEYVKNPTTLHQSILNNMEDWVTAMPRQRIHYDDLNMSDAYDDERQPPLWAQDIGDPFALIHMTKKFLLEPKIIITKRIVFVGASTTTISCLEKLVSSTYKSFKHLTVIDPYGLPGTLPYDPAREQFFSLRNGGTKMSYDSDREWVQRTGVHLWVQVVMGRVTSISREGKYVVVNSECIVPYDKLILAPGQQFQRVDCPEPEINDPNFMAFKKNTATHELQDTTNLKFNRDIPKPKNVFLVNTEVEADVALDFIKNFRSFMKKKKLLIFGGGIPTYACVKALMACEIPPERIVMITTPDRYIEWEKKSGYTLSSKLRGPMRSELEALGVSIVENYEFSHWETCTVSGLVKRTHFKSLTERDAHISFSTFALFCYRYKRVDDGIVSALSEAYILYQNGIVIDSTFKTNDPNIYAAGPAATYQKILMSDHQNHVFYQSEEIGHQLAEFLIESSATEGGGLGKIDDFNVIKFKKPLIRAIKLLGGWHYLYLRSPGSHANCNDFHGATCEEACECTTEVVTGSINADEDPRQRFFKVRLDDRSRIVSLECMSKIPFSFSNMSALYGKHETLLNKMMERLEQGETTCLYEHFCQSWFAVFCVDEWDNFAEELKNLYREHDIGDGIKLVEFIRDFIANLDNPEALQMDPNIIRSVWQSSKIKETVEEKLLNFLKFHRVSLPMFACHSYVEDLLEERSNSTLYYPNTKAHMVQ